MMMSFGSVMSVCGGSGSGDGCNGDGRSGGSGKSPRQSDIICSICLELVLDNGERAWTKLACGHFFHLDCIGSAFNSKGAMECPNCRVTENGDWRYANGYPNLEFDDISSDYTSTAIENLMSTVFQTTFQIDLEPNVESTSLYDTGHRWDTGQRWDLDSSYRGRPWILGESSNHNNSNNNNNIVVVGPRYGSEQRLHQLRPSTGAFGPSSSSSTPPQRQNRRRTGMGRISDSNPSEAARGRVHGGSNRGGGSSSNGNRSRGSYQSLQERMRISRSRFGPSASASSHPPTRRGNQRNRAPHPPTANQPRRIWRPVGSRSSEPAAAATAATATATSVNHSGNHSGTVLVDQTPSNRPYNLRSGSRRNNEMALPEMENVYTSEQAEAVPINRWNNRRRRSGRRTRGNNAGNPAMAARMLDEDDELLNRLISELEGSPFAPTGIDSENAP